MPSANANQPILALSSPEGLKFRRLTFDGETYKGSIEAAIRVTGNVTGLTFEDVTIRKLAESIYDDRELPSGHLNNLPILADALEDAGCDNHDILSHCRGPGPHVRGCWVVDLILGKE